MELEEVSEKLSNMHFDDIVKSYCNKVNDIERLKKIIDKQPSIDLVEILKECRDQLVMCTLIDKSGQCQDLVSKVDAKMGW